MGYQLGKKVTDEGIWKEFDGAKFKIARAGSVEYMRAKEKLERPYRKKIEKGTLSVDVSRDINLKALAQTILIGWDGVNDEAGEAIPYDEELGVQALTDDPDLLEFVMDVSLDNENFAIERKKAIAKKSSKPSAG